MPRREPDGKAGPDAERVGQVPPPEGIEEIAEDLLVLLRRMKSVEERQREQGERLDLLVRSVETSMASTGRALDALRRDLLGERKALASRHVLEAVAPVLEASRAMRRTLDPEREAATHAQLSGVISALANVVQGLGFLEYDAAVGDPFDPGRMECVGFLAGQAGAVLAVVRPGYSVGGVVVRPAGVLIAAPARPAETLSGVEPTSEGARS